MTAHRIFQYLIHRDTVDLRFMEESKEVEELHDETAIVYSRKTEPEHKHKTMEQLWIEHEFCNEGQAVTPMNTTQMMNVLHGKEPTLFARLRPRGGGKSRDARAGPDVKASFVKLIHKHAPQLRMTKNGSTVKFYVKRGAVAAPAEEEEDDE